MAFGLFLLLLAPSPARAAFKMRSVTVNGQTYVFLRDVATYYAMRYAPQKGLTVLSSGRSRLDFTIDKRECALCGVTVHLSFAPTVWQTETVMSERDFLLLLDPILRGAAVPKQKVSRIMLDPGHGGRDVGGIGKLYQEKTITLALSRRLTEKLEKYGYVVNATRTSDVEVDLERRAPLAENWRADLFISLHCNLTEASEVKGVETFLVAPEGTPSTYSNSPKVKSCSGNRFDKQNSRLAYEVHRSVVAAVGARDRGIKHAQFAVLRSAPCPAALIEIGFLSNRDEEKRIGSADHQDKIAAAIAAGIVKYRQSMNE
ncbi:MAG: hypothetical protein A3K19_07075 [Lentisphaerae bacterium RIFOXYB12_FULL_65_16]|nr:MAG: hypothetical protein A3K18_12250 [Lentisphaerae bacterium RIFOXYA12_64_32]OGV93284.1 MAG: hypothetical protein A3K19_07075 [Lentisphaerae bacterium RIFOXYB12_FULL_65_16]